MIHVRGLANLLEGVLERSNVAAAHMNDGVGTSRDRSRVNNVGYRLQKPAQFLGSDGTTAEEFDVRLGLQPLNRGVNGDSKSTDDPSQHKSVHPPLYGGGREPHDRPNLSVGGTRVVTQLVDDAAVEDVHGPSL